MSCVRGSGVFRPLPHRDTVAFDTPVKFAMSVSFNPPFFRNRVRNCTTGLACDSLMSQSPSAVCGNSAGIISINFKNDQQTSDLFCESSCYLPDAVYIAAWGKIHIGDVQARSCSVGSFSSRNGRPNRFASHVDHRQVGFSSART